MDKREQKTHLPVSCRRDMTCKIRSERVQQRDVQRPEHETCQQYIDRLHPKDIQRPDMQSADRIVHIALLRPERVDQRQRQQ